MPTDLSALGMPVEVSGINKELKKLWTADQGRTRATLFNFAVVCQGEQAMAENTELLSHFVRLHAFHALLLGIEPATGPNEVKAWVNAHCFLPRAGAKQICCDQVSIFIRGKVRSLLPNLLFGHLDYDLPLTLWWRGENLADLDAQVWRWVDRLVFDSQSWAKPRPQFATLREAAGGSRTVLCDLAWTRTLRLRQALAHVFDAPETMRALPSIRRAVITHAPGARTSAALLVGWLAAQLGWLLHDVRKNKARYAATGGNVDCEFVASEGATISRLETSGDLGSLTATLCANRSFLQIQYRDRHSGKTLEYVMPADYGPLWETLNEELASWGRHSVYRKALASAEALL